MEPKNISENVSVLSDTYGVHEFTIGPTILIFSIYLTIFLVGVFGNLATCIVIVKNPAMRNVTNYYLLSLAISDLLLLLISMPVAMVNIWITRYSWPFGILGCKFSIYICQACVIVSLSTITAFSFERYEAICHPFRLRMMEGPKKPIFVILSCWAFGFLTASPVFLHVDLFHPNSPENNISNGSASKVFESGNIPETYVGCGSHRYEFPYFAIFFLVSFLVPTIMIVVFYVKIGLKIHESARSSIFENQDPSRLRARNSVTKILCAVVVTYFICFVPYHISRIIYVYTKYYSEVSIILIEVAYYMGTAANPILYNAMSSRYRKAFSEAIYCASVPVREQKNESSIDKT